MEAPIQPVPTAVLQKHAGTMFSGATGAVVASGEGAQFPRASGEASGRAPVQRSNSGGVAARGRAAEVALALGYTPRLCRLRLLVSPSASAFSAWPLATSSPQQ